MKIILMITLAISAIRLSFSQTLDSKFKIREQELKNMGIDTIVIYFKNCIPDDTKMKIISDTCLVNQSKYLFWIKDGVFYKQEFNNCVDFSIHKLSNSAFIKSVITNVENIKKSDIGPVLHYVKDPQGRIERDEVIILEADHYCQTNFFFIFGNMTFSKSIKDYELDTDWFYEKIKNDNYEKNQKSILKLIKDLVEKEI